MMKLKKDPKLNFVLFVLAGMFITVCFINISNPPHKPENKYYHQKIMNTAVKYQMKSLKGADPLKVVKSLEIVEYDKSMTYLETEGIEFFSEVRRSLIYQYVFAEYDYGKQRDFLFKSGSKAFRQRRLQIRVKKGNMSAIALPNPKDEKIEYPEKMMHPSPQGGKRAGRFDSYFPKGNSTFWTFLKNRMKAYAEKDKLLKEFMSPKSCTSHIRDVLKYKNMRYKKICSKGFRGTQKRTHSPLY